MELSIIVPVYNMAADGKLEYCLNSLLQQSITDYEIIAVDDASTDQSPQILLEYAALYPDVLKVYFSPKNLKQGGAKNIGLQHAKGRWIGFVDSDDWVHPRMYEKLLAKAKETGADMVACNYHLTKEHSEEIGKEVHTHYEAQTGLLDPEKYKLLLLDSGSLVIKIYRRSLIYDCGMAFPEHIFYEDNAIANAIMLKAKHFAYVDEPLYAYYQHQASTVHTISRERCEHRLVAARLMLKHAKDFGYLDTYFEEIEFKFTVLFYVNTVFSYLQGEGSKDLGFLKSLQKEMKAAFPDFEQNKYYKERVGKEERMFLHLQQRSTLLMYGYYRLKWFVRNLRKKGLGKLALTAFMGTLGVILCLLVAAGALFQNKTITAPILIMGDSIVANDYPGEEMDAMLSEGLGRAVFNGAFGGTFLSNQNIENCPTAGAESLSLETLTDSMITGNYLAQFSVIEKIASLDYYESRLEEFSQIDFHKTEILILAFGANDYAYQLPPTKVAGALEQSITRLKKAYPDMRLVVSSPAFCYLMQDGVRKDCDTTDLGPYTMESYVEAMAEVCDKLKIDFVDNYHNSEINGETIGEYAFDGLHLNEDGRRIVVENILYALENGQA